jgi:hypothetical protein
MGNEQITVKLFKTDLDNFAVRWVASSKLQADKNGHTIFSNETHAKFYEKTLKDGEPVWVFKYRLCKKCVNRCETCGIVVLTENARFCCEGHAQRSFESMSREVEDKEFWGEER